VWADLHELGWIEGRNLLVDRRYTNGKAELMGPLADELVRLKVEIIVTSSTEAAIAAKNATTNIPIVMYAAGDPVRTGLVASLSRPGGNVTGYSTFAPEIDAKRLALLHESLPAAQRVGVLVNPNNPIFAIRREEDEPVYRSLGMQPFFVDAASAEQLEAAVADVARRGAQALLVGSDNLFA